MNAVLWPATLGYMLETMMKPVFDDADPAAVAEGIKIAGYWNSGQDCTAASRVMAGPKIYDKLLEELVPAIESIKVADPAEGEDVEMGPVISKDQQERVFGFLERAETAEAAMRNFAEQNNLKLGAAAQPLRVALTGRTTSPGIFDVLAVLGRETVRTRLAAALAAQG